MEDPTCACRAGKEDAEHYIVMCIIYDLLRITLLNELNRILQSNWTVNVLLLGLEQQDVTGHEPNQYVFEHVLRFTLQSERFV